VQSTDVDYGSALWSLINGQLATTDRLPVNERTVAGLAGAWAAVTRIANAVSQMMTAADALGPDGRTPLATVPAVLADPCSGYDSFTFWKECVSTALMRGNFVGVKTDFDPHSGYPRQIMPVPIDSVSARFDPDGYVVYTVGGIDCSPDDIVHVRLGMTRPGEVMAVGVIEAHRRNLSGMLDLQGMTANVFSQGAVPSGVVQLATDYPTQEQVSAVKSSWIEHHGGRRTVAVTGRSMSYTPVSWSAEDAQFLESRQFSIAESALMFGLRPEDLGASIGGSSLTYANRTDDALQRITDSYVPVMLPFEQAWSRLIPGRNFVRGNVEALLRSTTRERYELHQLAQAIGVETVDESRELEAKPPLPPKDEQPALPVAVLDAPVPVEPVVDPAAEVVP
jgi:HK97 family phage portal protein